MSALKWFFVVIFCLLLYAGSVAGGIFVAIDRSLGSTDFVSGFIQRQNLGEIAATAQKSAQGGEMPQQLALISKLGFSVLEPEFKRQAKTMLDQLYAYLKGKNNEMKLVMDLHNFKQDAEVLKTAVDSMMRNETVGRLPRAMVEPTARLMLQKMPAELNLTPLATAAAPQLVHARKFVIEFYSTYGLILGLCAAMIIFIALALRNLNQILTALGITLLLSGLTLFIPWLMSESLTRNILSNFKGAGAATIISLGSGFLKSAFAIYVLSPLVLSLAGIAAVLAARFRSVKG